MNYDGYIGWDIGGAHLKFAQVDNKGQLVRIEQIACPLWKGLDKLDTALKAALNTIGSGHLFHAVTMTGELVDLFSSRSDGVCKLLSSLDKIPRIADYRVYAGKGGLVKRDNALQNPTMVASANWLATASYIASVRQRGILVDVGSTTTDIILFGKGEVRYFGYTDSERLQSGELLYTGAVRTPVMVIADEAPVGGHWHALAAEQFADMRDIYRLTGQLTEAKLKELGMLATSDKAGIGEDACARRLARMVGRDLESAKMDEWRILARYFAVCHKNIIGRSLMRMLSRGNSAQDMIVTGAGAGRFIARQLATELNLTYEDFGDLLDIATPLKDRAATCAPAVSLASLARDFRHTGMPG